jgi:hypothetical protein
MKILSQDTVKCVFFATAKGLFSGSLTRLRGLVSGIFFSAVPVKT